MRRKRGTRPSASDGVNVKGFIRAVAYNPHKNKVVGVYETENMVVNVGLNRLARLPYDTGADITLIGGKVTWTAWGTSTAPTTPGMTSLQALISAAAQNFNASVLFPNVASGQAQFTWGYGTNEGTTAGSNVIAEIALYDASGQPTPPSSGSVFPNMYCRGVLASPITKTTDLQVAFTYTIKLTSG